MRDIFVITEHLIGEFQDLTFEMLGKAKELAGAAQCRCIAVVFGNMREKTHELGVADVVLSLGGSDNYNPEAYAAAVKSVISARSPSLVFVGSTAMGMDIATPVGTALNMPIVGHCCDISLNSHGFTVTSQQYGGKMKLILNVSAPLMVSVLAGSFKLEEGRSFGSPAVEEFTADSGAGKVRFKALIEPGAAEVDITQSEVLVAIGRGIGRLDKIKVVKKLTKILNADIACSRPLVDIGWLPKAHQVGKSGMKVNPKVYLALGISGAPEHIEGMKNSSTIIAINTDKQAPIFDVAHYGMTEDLFKVCETLLNELG